MYTGNRRRRWVRWGLAWFAGTLALMVIGLVIEQAVAPAPKGPQSLMPSTIPALPGAPGTTPAAAPSPTPSPAGSSPALSGTVQVVQGAQEINGVSLGFPHSTVGAVSAADADVTEVLSTLDPDRAAAVMRMIAGPSFAGGPQQAAEGAVNDRKAFGLPASGPLPPGASLETEPVEYQARDVGADQALVLLLCDFISTAPSQGTSTRIGVFPLQMQWSAGDWKVASVGGSSYANLAAEPDSPQSAALGWQALDPAGG
jgi:hypothetical protein